MQPYDGVDFLQLDDLLTDQEKQVRESVREFVSEKFMPVVAKHYQAGTFPFNLVPAMGEMGLLGCNLQGYGCAGMSDVEYGLIMMELERGDSGLRSLASVQTSLCMYPIYSFGSEAQKKKHLPEMAAGRKIGCFGLTEPDFGSNPSGMLTTAKKKGKGYVLNGTKRWITNANIADLYIVWAKLDGEIQGFLIPKDTPGLLPKEIGGKLSLRCSVTGEFVLDNCEIPEDAILPEAKGLKAALSCLSSARYGIVWGALGAAMSCYHEALNYAKEREVFGEPLAAKQLVQSKLVWMITEITKGQLLAYRLGQLKQQGKIRPQQISMGKMNNVQMALDIARVARDILGASGISDEYQCMRHACNLESVNTYEGTFDVHKLIIGEKITGIAAF
ncbi:MAG: acyl-CoA dehydrogenase family protein [Deltaproteobacteria bacterium]|nr:acyl-CoA dehydrogenase family protein [Deltaproteobacteria bacterium]